MKFYTLFCLIVFIVGTFANQEMGPDQDPGEGRCNVYKKCPLKKQYKNSKLSKKELEKEKYHQCCSYYSHCGESPEYCGLGCQFGDCLPEYKDQTRQMLSCHPLYVYNRCTPDCPCLNGQCCSKYGYCGTTDEFCAEGNRMITTTSFSTYSTKTSPKTTTTTSISTYITKISTKTATSSTSTSTTSSSPTVKGMCGKGIGKCPKGQCCSKYGWCGKSKDHCDATNGCQPEFGICTGLTATSSTTTKKTSSTTKTKSKTTSSTTTTKKTSSTTKTKSKTTSTTTTKTKSKATSTTTTKTKSKSTTTTTKTKSKISKTSTKKTKTTTTTTKKDTKGKCGKGYGKCPKDYCCSKYGWCGKSTEYCSVKKGCQSEFGKCDKN